MTLESKTLYIFEHNPGKGEQTTSGIVRPFWTSRQRRWKGKKRGCSFGIKQHLPGGLVSALQLSLLRYYDQNHLFIKYESLRVSRIVSSHRYIIMICCLFIRFPQIQFQLIYQLRCEYLVFKVKCSVITSFLNGRVIRCAFYEWS